MGIKGILTKVGLVEDDLPTAKPVAKPPVTSGSTVVPTATTFTSTAFVPTPVVDSSIQEMLNQSLQENKLSGFDYLKFMSAVDEARSTGVAEDARYKMIFGTAKQLGVDKNSLLKSGQHYVDVLSQDENDFNADCAQYEKTQVQAREAKIANIESTITQLNNQLSQLNQDHATLAQELQQEKAKLETRKAAFRVTLDSIRSTIKSNIDKINQYL